MKTGTTHLKYRADIDGLRALAVLVVVFYHLDISVFSGGYVGVDIFFVISGFLITKLLKNELEITGKLDIKDFYIRRFRRIYPALITTLIITALISSILFSPSMLKDFGGSLVSSVFSISNIYFWDQINYFDLDAKLKPLLHTWSLGIEEQFYLFWPIILILAIKTFSRPVMIIFLVILFSVSLNFIFASIEFFTGNVKSILFYWLPFRVFEFGMGAILPFLKFNIKSQIKIDIIYIIGLILIIYSILTYNDEILFPYYFALLPAVGAAILIYYGEFSRFNYILTNRLFVLIGLISYSIYLVHWPIIVFWKYSFVELDFLAIISIIVLTAIVSIFLYKFIEVPFRRKNIKLNKIIINSIIISIFVIIPIIGLSMYLSGGWSWRISHETAENTTRKIVFNAEKDASEFYRVNYGGAGYPINGVNPEKPADIVLMGDSHGKHYSEGLYKIITKPTHKVLHITAGFSCFYLPNFTRISTDLDYDKLCPYHFKRSIDTIKNGNNPIVILAESWENQLSLAALLDDNGKRLSKQPTIEDVIEGILALKKMIGDSKLIVIGQVPTTNNTLLYDILSRPRADYSKIVNDDNLYYSIPETKRMEINLKLRNASKESGLFYFIDPFEIFCEDGKCRNFTPDGDLIYSDTHHLSKAGSLYFFHKSKNFFDGFISK